MIGHGQAQLLATSDPGQNNWLEMSPEPMSPSAAGTQKSRETLWEEAYDFVRARNSRLVTWYETILTPELESTVANLPSRNASSTHISEPDRSTRLGDQEGPNQASSRSLVSGERCFPLQYH